MKKKKRIVSLISLVIILIISVVLVVNADEKVKEETIETIKVSEIDIKSMAASATMVLEKEEETQEENPLLTEVEMEIAPSSVKKAPVEIYDEMSLSERVDALYAGTLHLEYYDLYTYSGERLTKSKGAQYYNGHRETYYSERVLPGTGLNIPGRHVAADGTIRDGDGYICVAADPGFMSRGSILITSLGPAKVYDTGCAYGTIDIYVNW